jgi:hypothetical protein
LMTCRLVKIFPFFRRMLLPPSSGLCSPSVLLDCRDLEGWSSKRLRIVGDFVIIVTISYSRKLECTNSAATALCSLHRFCLLHAFASFVGENFLESCRSVYILFGTLYLKPTTVISLGICKLVKVYVGIKYVLCVWY